MLILVFGSEIKAQVPSMAKTKISAFDLILTKPSLSFVTGLFCIKILLQLLRTYVLPKASTFRSFSDSKSSIPALNKAEGRKKGCEINKDIRLNLQVIKR